LRTGYFVLLLLLIIPLLEAPFISADGCIFWNVDFEEHVYLPDQKAVIEWDGTNQTMTISSRFTSGNITDLAWIVPLYSKITPTVTKGDSHIFQEIAYKFAETQSIGKENSQKDLSNLLLTLLFSTLIIIYIGIVKIKTNEHMIFFSISLLLIFIILLLYIPLSSDTLFLTDMSKEDTVHLVNTTKIDIYDIAILQATNATDLLDWLQANKFNVSIKATDVLEQYCLCNDTYFIVNRINMTNMYNTSEQIAWATKQFRQGFATPLTFHFETEQPFYPMTITSINEGNTKINVYVIANTSMMDTSGLLHVVKTKQWHHKNYSNQVITWLEFDGPTNQLIKDSFFSIKKESM